MIRGGFRCWSEAAGCDGVPGCGGHDGRGGDRAGSWGSSGRACTAREDPRWSRALPWVWWLTDAFGPWSFVASGGLALLNVGLPLLIFWLAVGKRRRFKMWSLLVLPLAAAVPLLSYRMIAPSLEVWPGALSQWESVAFLAGTRGGDSDRVLRGMGGSEALAPAIGNRCLRCWD